MAGKSDLIIEKHLSLYPVEELNSLLESNILIVKKNLQKKILKNAFVEKKILTFKLMSCQEAEQFFNPQIKQLSKFYIFQKNQNYEEAKQIYKHLGNSLNYFNGVTDFAGEEKFPTKNNKIKLLKEYYELLKAKEAINNIDGENNKLLTKQVYSYGIDSLLFPTIDIVELVVESKTIVDSKKIINIFQFDQVEEEIISALNYLSNQITTSESSEQIIVYAPENYIDLITIIGYNFNISLEKKKPTKYLSNQQIELIITGFLDNTLKEKFESSENLKKLNVNQKNRIFQVINDYVEVKKDPKIVEFLVNEFRKKDISTIYSSGQIIIKGIEEFDFDTKTRSIILGFNDKDFVKMPQKSTFLTDFEAEVLGIPTHDQQVFEKDKQLVEIFNFLADNQSQVYISFATKVYSESVKVCEINSEIKSNIISGDVWFEQVRYSYQADAYLFAKDLQVVKNNENLFALNSNVKKEKGMQEYSSSIFADVKIDLEQFKQNNKISATSLTGYFSCQYFFYLQRVLKVRVQNKNQVNLDVGTYIHGLLEAMVDSNYQRYGKLNGAGEIYAWDSDLINKDVTTIGNRKIEEAKLFKTITLARQKSIKFRINNYMQSLVPILLEQINLDKLKVLAVEQTIELIKGDFELIGKIDQVLIDDNNNYFVIDYKSGKSNLKLSTENLELGIDLQNVFYFILLKAAYPQVKFGGTYRLKITPEIVRAKKKLEDVTKRNGLTNVDPDVITKINLENYQGIKYKKDGGFKKGSAVIESDQFEQFEQIINQKTEEFIVQRERNTGFAINPLKTNNRDACMYCPYQNICFKTNKNYQKD